MYEAHWQLKRSPFGSNRDADLFFASQSHHDALLKLRYLIDHRRGAGLMIGASGTGKTHVLDVLLQTSEKDATPIVKIVFPMMSPAELITFIANELGGEVSLASSAPMDIVLRTLTSRLRALTAQKRPAIIVIDDAHTIPSKDVLQSLQLLLNFQTPGEIDFTLILAGHPELVSTIKRLPQLDDRITMPCVLRSLTPFETTGYIHHRLHVCGASKTIFSEEAFDTIHELSGGIPRRINRLCDFAMLVGCAEDLDIIGPRQIEGVDAEFKVARAA